MCQDLKQDRAFPDDLNHQIGKNVILKLKRTAYNKNHPGSSINVAQVTQCEDLLQKINSEVILNA